MTANFMSTSARRETVEGTDGPVISKDAQKSKEDLATLLQTALQAKMEDWHTEKEAEAQPAQEYTDQASSELKWGRHEEQQREEDEEILTKNSVILNILQSLPPMPAIGQQQAVQPQVLNGE